MAYGTQETPAGFAPRPGGAAQGGTWTAGERLPGIVVAARIAHGLIALVFLCCIAVLYVDAWRGSINMVTLAALAALWVEGVLVLMSRGSCPLEPLFRKLGDETPLFELLLPPRAAELAVPALGALSMLGAVLLGVRTL
jgi:hypothetical protein